MRNEPRLTLKKLTRNTARLFQGFALIIIICLAVVIGGFSYLTAKAALVEEIKNATPFDPFSPVSEARKPGDSAYKYSKLNVILLSNPFAFSGDNSLGYCIAVDNDYFPYIVALKTDSMDQYQELINYTYSYSTDIPPALVLKGMPIEMSDELNQLAIDGINVFYGDNIATATNIKEISGSLYLNTAKAPSGSFLMSIICYVLGVAAIFLLAILIYVTSKDKKRLRGLMAKYSAQDLMNIDDELNTPSTLYLNSENLYITSNYFISRKPELEIIPIKEITQINGYKDANTLRASQGVVVVTRDGADHKIALLPAENKFNSIADQIVENLKSKVPDIQYGIETSFSATGTSGGEDPVIGTKNKLLLGVLGAIIGATLGGILWVFLGLLGYISGLAGLVMIFLAIGGYSLLSGNLDLKGKIISVTIAILMVFVANYTKYVFGICRSNNSWSFTDIFDAFRSLPALLTATDYWGRFLADTALGYLLIIVASIFMLSPQKARK